MTAPEFHAELDRLEQEIVKLESVCHEGRPVGEVSNEMGTLCNALQGKTGEAPPAK
jgi:hypothetical protein